MSTTLAIRMKLKTPSKPAKARKEKVRRAKKKMSTSRTGSPPTGGDSQPGTSAARVKRFHSKSRKGCLTCRQRRVKCDEQRTPKCLRCSKGGYICEWQESRAPRSWTASSHLSSSITRSPSQATLASEDNNLVPSFFTRNVASSAAALFVDMSQSFILDESKSAAVSAAVTKFYYQFVYNACQISPIIRRTLDALTGLWEQAFLTSQNSSPRHYDYYISRYSQVVTEFRTSLDDSQPDIVLITSILFANCEYVIGDLSSAVIHLREGAKYLQVHKAKQDGCLSAELLKTLEAIFDAFDHQGIDFDCSTPSTDILDPARDSPFTDLSCANDDLLQIYSHTFALNRIGYNHPVHFAPAAQDFQRWADTWKYRTVGLQESLDVESTPWLDLLHGQHSALKNMLHDMTSAVEQPNFDEETLDEMVLQVSTFLQTCSASVQDPSLPSRPYQGSAGLILPLYMVVLRCMDNEICETALRLLSRLQITEGNWNSCCAYTVARSILNARCAMRYEPTSTIYTTQDYLPIAQAKCVTAFDTGTELEIMITFPYSSTISGQNESNAIVGAFCMNNFGSIEKVCATVNSGGFQGPVIAGVLDNCHCQHSV